MSGLEIERKFLVKKGDAYKSAAFSSSHIQQGYIPAEGATVRVRTRDEKAYLTIKGKSVNGGMTRYEFEKEITMDEAQHLLQLCQGGVIDKRRYLVKTAVIPSRWMSSMAIMKVWSWQRWSWQARPKPMKNLISSAWR